jgi:hypothetical protein
MKLKTLLICLLAVVCLAGCKGSGSAGSGGGGLFAGGGGVIGGGGDDGSGSGPVNPEPATVALLGSGLTAYVLLKKNKKKK